MPEELCSHCGEFGVEGHITPRLRLRRYQIVPLRSVAGWPITADIGKQAVLHDRCFPDWLNTNTDFSLASIDAAV